MTPLIEAPPGRHFAQFHRDAAALTESVYTFIEAGVRRAASILIVAPKPHAERLLDGLADGKLHPRALSSSGQLAVVDSAQLLDEIMGGGTPDWGRFRTALRPVLARMQPFGHGMRIYSEVAGVLWQDGNTEAAIRVEELWNDLAASYQFALYCGYTMDTQCERAYAAPLEELGRTHSDILGTQEDELFGVALDRASKEIFGIALTQMAGVSRQDGARRFPSGQRAMLWVKRNLPMSSGQLVERARQYFQEKRA